MKIILEFDSSVAITAASGVTEASAYGGSFSGTTFTTTGVYDVISDNGGSIIPDNAYRTYYVDFPIINVGNYLNDVYTLVFESPITSASKTFSTDEAIRNFQNALNTEIIKTLISGSKVVNTTLNELVYYADTVNSDGSVTGAGAKSTLLLRQKLFDAQGAATSINPVEKQAYNSNLSTYSDNLVSGALSALQ